MGLFRPIWLLCRHNTLPKGGAARQFVLNTLLKWLCASKGSIFPLVIVNILSKGSPCSLSHYYCKHSDPILRFLQTWSIAAVSHHFYVSSILSIHLFFRPIEVYQSLPMCMNSAFSIQRNYCYTIYYLAWFWLDIWPYSKYSGPKLSYPCFAA